MTSTFTTNKYIEQPASGDYASGWATPVNNDWAAIDTAFGGSSSVSVTGVSGTVTWTTSNISLYRPLTIVFTGTLSANVVYQLPSGVGGQWVVYNNTSGSYTLTFGSAGGGSNVIIPSSTRVYVSCDGTNVYVIGNTVLNQNQSFMRNRLINGAFQVYQRGPSVTVPTSTLTYTFDRWLVGAAGAAVVVTQNGSATPGNSYSINIAGATGNTSVSLTQRIESLNVLDITFGSYLTLSGYVFQSTGSAVTNLQWVINAPTASDNWASQTNISPVTTVPSIPSGTWTYFSQTVQLTSSTANGIGVSLGFNTALTAGTNLYFSALQLELGQFATAFERRQYGTEFSLCQRYYEKISNFSGSGYALAAGSGWPVYFRFAVVKRTTSPTISATYTPSNCTVTTINISSDQFAANAVSSAAGLLGWYGGSGTINAEL